MTNELIRDLIANTGLLLSISIIYNLFFLSYKEQTKFEKRLIQLILGVIIGAVGLLLMMNTVSFSEGIIFDTRSILISVSGLFFGFVPTCIAALMVALYRVGLGGSGALTGVLVTLASALIGLLWHHFRLERICQKQKHVWIELYLFGVIVHIAMLACMLTLPYGQISAVLTGISLPVIIIYPLGSLVLCLLMLQGLKNRENALNLLISEENYKQLFSENQKKESLLISLLDSIADLVFYKDENSVYLGCNRAFEEFAGKEKEELIGLTDYDLFDQDMAAFFQKMDKAMMAEKKERRNEEIVTYPDGRIVHLETLKTPFYDPDGKILGLIGVSRDITERKKSEAEILYLSQHDVLTGLHNRAFYELERIKLDRPEKLPLSIIIGDINGLKLINDAFGHAAGDKLIVKIADIIRGSMREDDVLARTGGDEFVVLLPNTSYTDTGLLVDRIKSSCEADTQLQDENIYPSISLGYATKSNLNESLENIFKLAEESMYRKKLLEYKSFHSSIMESIKATLFEKSYETKEHAERMAEMSIRLGKALALDTEDLVTLELVAMLHDIGKISIDRNILTKTGKLSQQEWGEIKRHPEVGYRIVHAVPELRNISEFILCHHERWDGSGYPQGLKGDAIPLLSRIIAVADAYDAMTEDRSYRPAQSSEMALEEIRKNAGTQFDPKIVKIFIDLQKKK